MKALKSEIISRKIIDSDFYKSAKVVGIYSSISYEVDTSILIKKSIIDGKTVALPKVIDDEMMEFYKIHSFDDIDVGCFLGIKEPKVSCENFIDKSEIDLMIVPGICFDNDKNRVGFGKGYYDRYLTGVDRMVKVGVCFDEQLMKDKNIPLDEFDVKMDFIITDKIFLGS